MRLGLGISADWAVLALGAATVLLNAIELFVVAEYPSPVEKSVGSVKSSTSSLTFLSVGNLVEEDDAEEEAAPVDFGAVTAFDFCL